MQQDLAGGPIDERPHSRISLATGVAPVGLSRVRDQLPFLIIVAGVAASYFTAGRLGLLLAIPPGYAAPIWPAAACALIAALLYGRPALLGTWLGSVAVNIGHAWPPGAGLDHLSEAIRLPIFIGIGAAAGAGVGAHLIRRCIGFPSELADLRSIGMFLLLGGPLSCALSPSLGIGALVIYGVIPAENAAFNWMTWWVGDSLGVLLFSIVLLPFAIRDRGIWFSRRRTLPATLLITSGIMVLLYVQFSRYEVTAQQRLFEQHTADSKDDIQAQIDNQIANLHGVAGLFYSSQDVSREEFRTYSSLVLQRHPEIQALTWNPLVPAARRAELVAQANRDGVDDFALYERDHQGTAKPTQEREVYSPIFYLEPMKGNQNALGFDLLSNSTRQRAIQLALDSGRPTATEPIPLLSGTEGRTGVVIILPLFDSVAPPHEPTGTISGVFWAQDWISQASGRIGSSNLSLSISSQPDFNQSLDPPTPANRNNPGLFSITRPLQIADQTWWLRYEASQQFVAASRTYVPWSLLAGGLLFASLLGVFLLAQTGESYRTKEKNHRLQSLLLELETTQSELLESKRIVSLGAMVSGLAHELNTPIGVAVTANSCLPNEIHRVQQALRDDTLGRRSIDKALQRWLEASNITRRSLERASDLIRTFKTVIADRATQDIQEVDLHQCIAEAIANLKLLDGNDGLEIDFPPSKRPVVVQTIPQSVHQIVINLLNNAKFHAYKDGHGSVRIALHSTQDGGARICVEDQGHGIPKDVIGKVFDPFYTTRRGQGGTGLGLHIVHNLIKHQLEGRIEVHSQPDHGTRFVIDLPPTLN